MAINTFQVILSSDGKHTVIATTEDMRQTAHVQAWATKTYDALVKRYGLKGSGKLPETEAESTEDAPICAVHQVAMTLVDGRKGPFWSCHEKNVDGSWCSFRPESLTDGR